jgi:hypothetical protein
MRSKFSAILGIVVTVLVGIGLGSHPVYAAKVTASSYDDGYNRGVKDAICEFKIYKV